MIISVKNLLLEAVAREQEEHAAKEREKLGVLRAGNSGVMLTDKRGNEAPAGSCPRVAHLRTLGINTDVPEIDKLIMWDGGINNEEYWYKKLSAVWTEGRIMREHEIPIEWTLPGTGGQKIINARGDEIVTDPTKITGRPDMVLFKGEVPMVGIELKGIASIWTARDVSFEQGIPKGPKLAHLCQAGHYSKKLGEKFNLPKPLPYRIIYSSYVNFPSPLMFAGDRQKENLEHKMFPPPGHPGSDLCEYNDKGWLKNVKPHHTIYEVEWGGDQLKFKEEGADKWNVSPVTWSGIEAFYKRVQDIPKDLGQRPLTLSGSGTKLNYSTCGYCPLQATCDKHEGSGYFRWLQEVRRTLNGK